MVGFVAGRQPVASERCELQGSQPVGGPCSIPAVSHPYSGGRFTLTLIESCYMDFTTARAKGGVGWFGIRREGNMAEPNPLSSPAPDERPIMSFSAYDQQGSAEPEHGGPVLVMPPPQKQKPSHLWVKRLWLVTVVLVCLEVGIILIVLPWSRLWTENSLLLGHPQLAEFLQQNFVRGLVSGLGLVDVWMGIAEAVRYREGPDA